MTTHISFDIETWGTESGCDIRSIGACVFSPDTGLVHDGSLGTIRPFYIACDNPISPTARPVFSDPNSPHADRTYPLYRDPRTVQWWSEQSDEAQAAFADPVDLCDALDRFKAWLHTLLGAPRDGNAHLIDLTRLRLWSHGAHFDPPILAAAYKAVGLPVPWHYRAPRDTRTAFDMAGIDDHSAWLAQFSGDDRVQHHALSDAICQARAVCGAMARIGSVTDEQFDEIGSAMVNLSALMRRDGFLHNPHNHDAYERVVSLWQNAIGHPNGKELRS